MDTVHRNWIPGGQTASRNAADDDPACWPRRRYRWLPDARGIGRESLAPLFSSEKRGDKMQACCPHPSWLDRNEMIARSGAGDDRSGDGFSIAAARSGPGDAETSRPGFAWKQFYRLY